MALRQSHHMFLQEFMSKGILSAKEVMKAYRHACGQFNEIAEEAKLADFVRAINAAIVFIHLEIRKATSEETGSNYYVLINKVENDIAKLASEFTKNELEVFKKIIARVVDGNSEGVVSSMEIMNFSDTLHEELENVGKRMSKKDVEDLLRRLVASNWLHDDNGKMSLSTRSLCELDPYIREQFPDFVTKCNGCHSLCIKGENCEKCDVRLHHHCAARMFSNSPQPRCPNAECITPWKIRELSS